MELAVVLFDIVHVGFKIACRVVLLGNLDGLVFKVDSTEEQRHFGFKRYVEKSGTPFGGSFSGAFRSYGENKPVACAKFVDYRLG